MNGSPRLDATPRILALALTAAELSLIARAVEEIVAREDESASARNVHEMLNAPLEVGQLQMFADHEVFAA